MGSDPDLTPVENNRYLIAKWMTPKQIKMATAKAADWVRANGTVEAKIDVESALPPDWLK